MNIFDVLNIEEGFSAKPYYCSLGYPTIATGKRIGPKGASLDMYQFEINKEIAAAWVLEDVYAIRVSLSSYFDWFDGLNQARRDIIVSMCYQLGFDGFLKFKKTIAFLAGCKFKEASKEMLNSKWHEQTPERANRHSVVILTGTMYGVY